MYNKSMINRGVSPGWSKKGFTRTPNFSVTPKGGGFTLIELLVVISIISLLASVVMASLNDSRGKSRDARRKQDLTQIRSALFLYYDKYGDWIQTGSGCGYGGGGYGWFNVSNGNPASYPKSIAQCLIDAGVISSEIKDPTGGVSSTPTSGFTYMKYSCGSPTKTYVFAKLEQLPQSATATDGTCCDTCDSAYGMNYYLRIE